MTIKLDGITLPSGLQWTDEFSQNKVSQTTQRTLAGSTVVYHGQRTNGFPITLESGSDHAWITRDSLLDIQQLADTAGTVMPLEIRGTTYQVMFSHQDNDAFSAVPIFPMADPTSTDYYKVKIKLFTV